MDIEAIGCVHLSTVDNCIYLFLNGKQKQTVTLEDPIKVNMVLLATHGDQHPLYTR